MNSEKAPEPIPAPNVSPGAASGLDPEVSVGTGNTPEVPDEGSGTRDGTVDDVRPLGLSEDPALDDPDYDDDDTEESLDALESGEATVGTVTDGDGNPVETGETAPSGDDSGQVDPGTGDDESGQQSGS